MTNTEGTNWTIEVKVTRGWELPEWHRADHGTLEAAQNEVVKLRQWDSSLKAIRSIIIQPVK